MWWDTIHTFHIAEREMTVTPYDFHHMTGLNRWKRMRVIERSVLKRKEKKWKQTRDKRWPSKESRDICEMSGGG